MQVTHKKVINSKESQLLPFSNDERKIIGEVGGGLLSKRREIGNEPILSLFKWLLVTLEKFFHYSNVAIRGPCHYNQVSF